MTAALSFDALGVAPSAPLAPFRVRARILGRHNRAVEDAHVQSFFAANEPAAIAEAAWRRAEWAGDDRLAALWIEDATGVRYDVAGGMLVVRASCVECNDTGRVMDSMAPDARLVVCAECVLPELGEDGEFYYEAASDDDGVRF